MTAFTYQLNPDQARARLVVALLPPDSDLLPASPLGNISIPIASFGPGPEPPTALQLYTGSAPTICAAAAVVN